MCVSVLTTEILKGQLKQKIESIILKANCIGKRSAHSLLKQVVVEWNLPKADGSSL